MPDVVQFDPIDLRIIEIDAGAVNSLSVQEVYSEWKAWLLADPSRLGYPAAFRQVGSDPISATKNLGTTYFLLNGWRFRPTESSHKVTLVGNIFTDPAGSDVFVETLGAFTVTIEMEVSNLTDAVLINSPEIQRASFVNDLVSIDPINGVAGTVYPIGTARIPVSNFADALSIAAAGGLRGFLLRSTITLTGVDVSEYDLVGLNHRVELTVDVSANVEDCNFRNLSLTGVLSGAAHITDCWVFDVSNVHGHFQDCSFEGDTVELSGAGPLRVVDCIDGKAGGGVLTFDLAGSGSALIVRRFAGGIGITNKTGADEVSVDGAIRLVLDATVAGSAEIITRGVGHVELNGSTVVIADDDLVNRPTIASALLAASTSAGTVDQVLTDLFSSQLVARGTVEAGSTAITLQTDIVSAANAFGGLVIVLVGASKSSRLCRVSSGSGTIEVVAAFSFAPQVGDLVFVLPFRSALASGVIG
jgi:hypothetical protein